MKNSELFIDAYNQIDAFLKKEGNYDNSISFTHKLKNSKNGIIKKRKEELISYGELRNVIVHSPKIGQNTIAEPSNETVSNIQNICNALINPKKVIPLFQCEVLSAKNIDFINDILLKMKEYSFSQFPVVDENGFVTELITNNTICRWLSQNIEPNGTIMVENTTVEKLLNEIEYKNNYQFVSRECSVIDVFDLFTRHVEDKEHQLDVVFITQNGKRNEKLLGIICIEDIAHEIKSI